MCHSGVFWSFLHNWCNSKTINILKRGKGGIRCFPPERWNLIGSSILSPWILAGSGNSKLSLDISSTTPQNTSDYFCKVMPLFYIMLLRNPVLYCSTKSSKRIQTFHTFLLEMNRGTESIKFTSMLHNTFAGCKECFDVKRVLCLWRFIIAIVVCLDLSLNVHCLMKL